MDLYGPIHVCGQTYDKRMVVRHPDGSISVRIP